MASKRVCKDDLLQLTRKTEVPFSKITGVTKRMQGNLKRIKDLMKRLESIGADGIPLTGQSKKHFDRASHEADSIARCSRVLAELESGDLSAKQGVLIEPQNPNYLGWELDHLAISDILRMHDIKPNLDVQHLRVLDLCAGSQCFHVAVRYMFPSAKVDYVSVDIDPESHPTHCVNITEWKDFENMYKEGDFDIIAAWPDCTQYSLMRTNAVEPRDLASSNALVGKIKNIIDHIKPVMYIIENPARGKLKNEEVMNDMSDGMMEAHYCMYGFPVNKPTKFWTNARMHVGDLKRCSDSAPCWCSRVGAKGSNRKHPMTTQYVREKWMRHQVPIPVLMHIMTAFDALQH